MDLALILSENYSNEYWTLNGNEYAGLDWLSDSPKPTKATLEKQWQQVEYDIAHREVEKQRVLAYQLESDPIFMEAQRDSSRTLDEWKAKVDEIKARYPYPDKPVV